MKPTPRLLPLLGVAVGGVLAIKALSGVQALPDLFAAAQAHAEGAPSAAKPAAKAPAQTARPAPPKAAPICAPSLSEFAKEASLSPAELQTLQSLQARRGQLDQRERDLDTQIQLLSAAGMKLDGKMKALTALKADIQHLLGQSDQQTQGEVDRLVRVYEKMKPRDAAAVMATLDDRVRIPVAAKMKEAALAAVLAQMPTVEAKHVTEALAHRFAPADQLIRAANAPATPPVADPLAAAAEAAQDDGADPAAPAAKAARKPHLRAARPRAHAARAKAPAIPQATAAAPAPAPAKTALKTPAASPVSKPPVAAGSAPETKAG